MTRLPPIQFVQYPQGRMPQLQFRYSQVLPYHKKRLLHNYKRSLEPTSRTKQRVDEAHHIIILTAKTYVCMSTTTRSSPGRTLMVCFSYIFLSLLSSVVEQLVHIGAPRTPSLFDVVTTTGQSLCVSEKLFWIRGTCIQYHFPIPY